MSLTSLEQRSGRLPAELTSFVGRRSELQEIARLYERSRLVTLCGPGGVGKTRLALRAAAELARDRTADLSDGVRFVDLSSLREPAMLAQAVAHRFELSDQEPAAALDVLVAHVADRRLLLVLDTCEHVVDAAAMLAEVLLRNAPGLRVLATSRQPLDAPGEHTVMVAPLPRPGPAGYDPAQPCDSVELFADRASAVLPGWTVTDANREAVALLCHRLDGIPLAIELAAVQLRVLSVDQLVERIGDRLMRVQGRRTAMPRHQTLRTAIDWSHELCGPDERLLWARLSVFAGDFDLESAEHVCADHGLPAEEILDVLAGLVAKSVVLRADRDDTVRYRMLDTIREYGAERLAGLGQEDLLRERAFGWFTDRIRTAHAELDSGAQPRWLRWFRDEQANVNAVLDHGLRTGRHEVLIEVMLGLGRVLALQGLIGEARHWLQRVVDLSDADAPRSAELLALSGLLATMQEDLEQGHALVGRAEERAEGDPVGLAYVRQVQGTIALYEDRMDEAIHVLTEAGRLHRAAGTRDVLVPITDVFLSAACSMAGDTVAGGRHATEVVRVTEGQGELWCRSYGLCLLALATMLSGDSAKALPRARAGLLAKDELEDRLGIALALDITGACLIGAGEFEAGVRLFGAGDRLRTFIGTALFGRQHAVLRGFYEQLARQESGAAAFEAAYRSGRDLDVAEAVTEALGRPAAADDVDLRPLTPRETEVAALVAEGLSNREIAERLVIAKRTVDSHVEHILDKLGFSSRAQIAAWQARRSP